MLSLRVRRKVFDPKAVAERQGQELRKAVFSGEVHKYKVLSPDKLPDLDHYFYDQSRETLENNRFRFLGDVENASLTEITGRPRTFTRCLASADGTIVAGARQTKSALSEGPDRYTIEFHTEFGDGTFFVTNNTGKAALTRSEPGIMCIFYPAQTPCEELLRIHMEAMAGKKASNPELTISRIETVEDYIHFSMRLHSVIARNAKAKGFVKPDASEAAARNILDQNKAIYASGPHEMRTVSPAEFPNLDHSFYDSFRDHFAAHGFRFVWDREDMTLTRVFPHQRTFIRVLLGADGTIMAGAYHIRNLSPEVRNMGLETEFSDGTFVTTSTAKDKALPVPGIDAKRYPATTPPDELLHIHKERVAQKLRSDADITAVSIRNGDECVQSQRRQQAIRAKHKQATGLVGAEDLKKIKGRQLLPHEQKIVAELERIKQAEQENPPQ
jgi:hypothetical protein